MASPSNRHSTQRPVRGGPATGSTGGGRFNTVPATPLHDDYFDDSFINPGNEYKNPPINSAFLRGTTATSSSAFLQGRNTVGGSTNLNSAQSSAHSRTEFTPLLRTTSKPLGTASGSGRNKENVDETPVPATIFGRNPFGGKRQPDSPGLLSYDEPGSMESIGSFDEPRTRLPQMVNSRHGVLNLSQQQDEQRRQQQSQQSQRNQEYQNIPLKRQEDILNAQQTEIIALRFEVFLLQEKLEKEYNNMSGDNQGAKMMIDTTRENIELKKKLEILKRDHSHALNEKEREAAHWKSMFENLRQKVDEERDDGSIGTTKDDQTVGEDEDDSRNQQIIKQLEEKLQQYEQDIDNLEDALADARSNLEEEEREAENYRQKYIDLQEKTEQDHRNRNDESDDDSENSDDENSNSETKDESRANDTSRHARLDAYAEKVEELQGQLEAFTLRLNEREEEIESLQAELQLAQDEKTKTSSAAARGRTDLAGRLDNREAQIKSLESKIASMTQKYSQLADQSSKQIQRLEQQCQKIQQDSQQQQQQYGKQAQQQLDRQREVLQENTDEIARLETENNKLQHELKQSRMTYSSQSLDIKKELADLRSQLSAERSAHQAKKQEAETLSKKSEMLDIDLNVVRRQLQETNEKIIKQEDLIRDLQTQLNSTKQKLNVAREDGASASALLQQQQEEQRRQRQQAAETTTTTSNETSQRVEMLSKYVKQLESKTADNRGIQLALRQRIADLQEDLSQKEQAISRLHKTASKVSDTNRVLEESSNNVRELQTKIQQLTQALNAAEADKTRSSAQLTELLEGIIKEVTNIESFAGKQWYLKNAAINSNLSAIGSPLRKAASFNSNYQRNIAQLQEELSSNEKRGSDLLSLQSGSILSSDGNLSNRVNSALGKLRLQVGAKVREILQSSMGENTSSNNATHLQRQAQQRLEEQLLQSQQQLQKSQVELDATQRENSANLAKIDDLQELVTRKLQENEEHLRLHEAEIYDLQSKLSINKDAFDRLKRVYDLAKGKLERLQRDTDKNWTGSGAATSADHNGDAKLELQDYLKKELLDTRAELKILQDQALEVQSKLHDTHRKYKDREHNYKQEISKLVQQLSSDRENGAILLSQKLKEKKRDLKTKYIQKYESEVHDLQQLKQQIQQQYQHQINPNGTVATPQSQLRERHLVWTVLTLVEQAKHLHAKVDREGWARADLSYMKEFFLSRISSYKDGKEAQAKLLRQMGVLVDYEGLSHSKAQAAIELDKLRRELFSTVPARTSYMTNALYGFGSTHAPLRDPRSTNSYFSGGIVDPLAREKWARYRTLAVQEGKRKIRKAAFAAMAINRMRMRVSDRDNYKDHHKHVRLMLRGLLEFQREHRITYEGYEDDIRSQQQSQP